MQMNLKNKNRLKSSLVICLIFLSTACTTSSKKSMPENQESNKTAFDLQGHRGARGLYPENSIPGFLHALDLGVTTLELDVCVSKDSQLIVSHEPWFSHEICLDPNGNPILQSNEKEHNLYQLTAKEIATYDCGTKPHPRFPGQKKLRVHKPTLQEMVVAVEAKIKTDSLDPVYYNIETKSTSDGDGRFHPKPKTFSGLLYEELKKLGILERSIVQSFDVRTLQAMREIDTTLTLALLVENKEGLEQNLARLGFVPEIYSPYYKLVTEDLVKSCHAKQMKIIPWTVNTPEDMKHLKNLGVDGLITDYPDQAQFLIQPNTL